MNLKVDSRKIKKGDTFLALRGVKTDGHNFIKDAIKNGASKIIAEECLYKIDNLIVKDTREYLIEYLDSLYKEKFKNLKIIGITGTNGKTTTAYLIYQALNKLGYKCAYIGTIGFYMENKIKDLNNTTPDIYDLYEMLNECASNNCLYVTMEVSSHSLAMNRIGKLNFDYAIFTNLTKDHLDYHDDMNNYALAKQKLFKKIKGKAIVNYDDENKNYFLLENDNILYGFNGGKYKINNYKISHLKTYFELKIDDNIYKFDTKLIGKHNIYNVLCTIIVLLEENFKISEIKKVISNLSAPDGRMDTILKDNNQIIVDYAHTPDAVKNIIQSSIELKPNRVITIIGCGGDRDKTKRPEMALIATSLSNYVIFTSDNPRSEDPNDIINDMLQKLDNNNYEIEVNRKNAIIRGIQMLEENDILLVLGKGHETYQIIGDVKYPFDDKKIIEENI